MDQTVPACQHLADPGEYSQHVVNHAKYLLRLMCEAYNLNYSSQQRARYSNCVRGRRVDCSEVGAKMLTIKVARYYNIS